MPRRRYQFDDEELSFEDTQREAEDVCAAPGIPTLYEIRKHITDHAWNGGECLPAMSNEEVFEGQCEYASTAMSEMLTGTGHNTRPRKIDWSLRVRGWYCGDLSGMTRMGDTKQFPQGLAHCHSWVLYKGKIYDPTWWQFTGDAVRVYVFDSDDPRFIPDPEA